MPNPSTVLSGLIAQNAMSKLSLSACFRIMSALSGVICVCVCVCVCIPSVSRFYFMSHLYRSRGQIHIPKQKCKSIHYSKGILLSVCLLHLNMHTEFKPK